MTALLPCPFCGGTDLMPEMGMPAPYGLYCRTCKAAGPNVATDDPDPAIAAWNTRAPVWQPIETAPNYHDAERLRVLAWNKYLSAVEMVLADGGFWRQRGADCSYTAWMPLPAAPQEIGE